MPVAETSGNDAIATLLDCLLQVEDIACRIVPKPMDAGSYLKLKRAHVASTVDRDHRAGTTGRRDRLFGPPPDPRPNRLRSVSARLCDGLVVDNASTRGSQRCRSGTESSQTHRWSKADSNSESHPRATPPAATRFVADSALEGGGFEPSDERGPLAVGQAVGGAKRLDPLLVI
jgi:hypothetical protein